MGFDRSILCPARRAKLRSVPFVAFVSLALLVMVMVPALYHRALILIYHSTADIVFNFHNSAFSLYVIYCVSRNQFS